MTPPIQTSVAISFANTSIIEGSLYDHKDHMDIKLRIPNSADGSKVILATAVIGRLVGTSVQYTTNITLKKDGIVSIGTPTSVSSNEKIYQDASGNSFENGIEYSVRIMVTIQDNNHINSYHHSIFTLNSNTSKTYKYLHRDDGGDTFNTNNLSILNPNEIENGSDIVLHLPMNYEIDGDDKPTHILVNFDETDNYVSSINDTDNSEEVASYSSLQVYDDSNGNVYTLPTNTLDNDKTYVVTVTAFYAAGYSTTETIPQPLHVIAAPVINSITAYGLGTNKDGAGDPTISSVMNVYVNPSTDPVRILPVSNDVTFNLSQQDASGNPVIFYSATLPLSSDQQSDNTFLYTILKDNLTKVWTTTPPVEDSNGSYTYDVTMVIDYDVSHVTPNGVITKTSIYKPATFTSDINQITSVNIVNAWVAATNVVGTGDRVVDYSNATTAQGYDAAPEFGIVGYFNKHDFFGSEIVEGFFKDLDSTDTKFQFKLSVDDGDFQAVQTLFMMQDDAAKTDQENTIDLFSNSTLTNLNGVYDNIPGIAGTPGSSQPTLRFCIPASELTRLGAVQGNSIKVSVALQPLAGQTTLPDATESGEVALLHKVKRYSMAFASDSEPKFDGSGDSAYLTVSIDNEKVVANDLYFSQALLYYGSNYSSYYSNNANENGIFDFLIENPNVRGTTTTFDYKVAYKVDDPNGGTIIGPPSIPYFIYLKDEPTAANFTVSNYEYTVFNDDSESSFQFDIQFQDVGNTSIDGVMVYFNETSVYKVERSAGDIQTITVTLTTTAASTSSVSHGIYISDINGNVSTSMWSNFDAATINFKPYYTPKVDSTNDEPVVIEDTVFYPILNIPVIDMPANVSLTGGVIESYNATNMSWDNDLAAKYDERSWIGASFYLKENNTDQTGGIDESNSYFEIGLGNTPSTYTMDLSVKIASTVDSRVFYSKSVVLAFDSVSVDMSVMTVTTKRGSADVNLKAEYVDYTTNPPNASNLNATVVQLIDNPNGNANPYDNDIHVLDCTSTEDAVQPDATINTYSIANDYDLADKINQEIRMEAGIDYTLKYGDATASNENSTPLYLTLNGPNTPYIVAKKPEITITGSCSVVSSGTYVGQTAVPMVINANGLKKEGLLSVVVVLVKENDYTNENDAADGAEIVLAFESSNGRLRSYNKQLDADTTTGSIDNLGPNEIHVLTVDDVEGFSETSSSNDFTLVCGTLDGSDESVLYLPSDCEFANSSFNVVAIVSTRVGTDFHINAVVPA
jgi:hypothetical protein